MDPSPIFFNLFISTTKLATNHGSISKILNLNMFNIHFHNQTRYQPWLHLQNLKSKHVQYSFSQPNSLPTMAPSLIFFNLNMFNIHFHNETRHQSWLHLPF